MPLRSLCSFAVAWLIVNTSLLPAQAPRSQVINRQDSWIIENANVSLAVTKLGGHMAPVTFQRNDKSPVQPYYISPWQDENLKIDVPVMVPLRGDFFCMPFGANQAPYKGETHPPHGEVAGSTWTLGSLKKSGPATTLELTLQTKARPGKVTKRLSLVDGHNVVYCQHVIDGFAGKTSLAHHATLAVPESEGSLRVSTSPFQFGMTNPVQFSNPLSREYQSLAIGARFTDLSKVPGIFKGMPDADCSSFPARTGFADLIALFNETPDKHPDPAWVAATNVLDRYVWFSLKDPVILPATVFWIENHGRHASPWNGRNRCIGLEDVCAYFAEGIVPSTEENVVTKSGIKTSHELSADKPFTVNYIQGAARIPEGFDRVKSIQFAPGQITLHSDSGKSLTLPVSHEFLKSGKL